MQNETFSRDILTEQLYDDLLDRQPIQPASAADVLSGIQQAIALDEENHFLAGLTAQLGIRDPAAMLAEVKRRYREILHKDCPRTVQEWVRGTTPGITNRQNLYELCYALELDLKQTNRFFCKHFLTTPFNCKASTDAVFLYCFSHEKPYETAAKLLASASGFVPQENAHTATSRISQAILECPDDDTFLRYLSAHCYGNKQQFHLARSTILAELDTMKQTILHEHFDEHIAPNRMNSITIMELLGYRYQSGERRAVADSMPHLPARYRQSLPNDVTLGKIVNGDTASYETLRKTMMLLRFYNFYHEADNIDRNSICANLMDFYEELNELLNACGFVPLYERHPFDCLLLYCANSYEPLVTLQLVNEY